MTASLRVSPVPPDSLAAEHITAVGAAVFMHHASVAPSKAKQSTHIQKPRHARAPPRLKIEKLRSAGVNAAAPLAATWCARSISTMV